MPIAVDLDVARAELQAALQLVEGTSEEFVDALNADDLADLEVLFASNTQAFREALVGVLLVRLQAPEADLTLPYANMGERAYNARTLDEQVVNPFLKNEEVPSSGSPYLSVLRRSRQFKASHKQGIRDSAAFLALVRLVERAQNVDDGYARRLLTQLIASFLILREKANVAVVDINRISLPQMHTLYSRFLKVRSGGLIPLITVACALEAMNQALDLNWVIDVQGINAADRASGASGDIVVWKQSYLFLSIEVTERVVDRSRVVSTFRAKIAPNSVRDYLFIVGDAAPDEEAGRVAASYFAQGHEVNFISIEEWLYHNLLMIGSEGRSIFMKLFAKRLRDQDVPAAVRVHWNELIRTIVS